MNTIKNTLVENLTTQGQERLSIESIKDKYIRENMKKLMENQIRQDVGSALNEDFTMGVGAPLGADQGIPHGGDAKAVFCMLFFFLNQGTPEVLLGTCLLTKKHCQYP